MLREIVYSFCFYTSVREVLLDYPISKFPYFKPIWEHVIYLTMRIFNSSQPIFVNFLDCAIRKHTFFLATGIQTFDGSIWKGDLFSSITKVLLNLAILEFENLDAVGERILCGFSLSEIVDNPTVTESLLDVFIHEKDNLIPVRPNFSLHAVRKNYFSFSTLVKSLNFTLRWLYFLNKLWLVLRAMILLRKNHTIIFNIFFFFVWLDILIGFFNLLILINFL